MPRLKIVQRVMEILVDQIGVDMDDLTEDTDITEDLGADSLDIIEIVMAIEEEWDIEIEDEEIASLKTIHQIATHIEQQN